MQDEIRALQTESVDILVSLLTPGKLLALIFRNSLNYAQPTVLSIDLFLSQTMTFLLRTLPSLISLESLNKS